MSKKATEFQRKAMSRMYRGKEIFKPLNTGWIDENVACVREWVANIFFYRKGDTTIMIDAGYNYDRLAEKMSWLGIDPHSIRHILITHQDTDHVGAVEADSPGLFRDAALYIGEIENRYLTGEVRRRVIYHLYKLPQVTINNEKVLLHDGEVIDIDGIRIECFLVPGHTWGHMVYLVDGRYLFTGDTIWFGADGGYSFISALAEDNKLAVKSLALLEKKLKRRGLHPLFITGHTGWGTRKDIEPYMDEKFQNNILLTQTERLTMNGRPANPKYARNKNVLVIGGSGSGKTRFYVKPNLMQMHSSYCVTDPKGTIVLECGKMLEDNGYEIKILNTINFKKSMKYNPFAYIRSEKDILKLVQTIIANTKGEGEKAGEDFWVKAEKLYYTALIGYIWYEAPREEKNFATLLDMIDASEVREDDETYMNPIDRLFEALEKKEPTHFAVKQYKKYKLAAGVIELRRTLNHYFSEICTS